jgi:trehalose-6-phosphate synthase
MKEWPMKKFLSSVFALFLFGSFAATSGAFASTQDGASIVENVDSQTIERQTVERLEMSEEEKQRRQDECVTVWEACEDWCKSTNKNPTDLWHCKDKCKKNLSDCMGKID